MGKKDLVRQKEVRHSDAYIDTLPAGPPLQTSAVTVENDLNALRSQIKRLIHGDDPGNWYDAPAGTSGSNIAVILPNGDSVTLEVGMPVVSIASTFRRGNASLLTTSFIVGLVSAGNTPTNPVAVVTTGPLELTTVQWDAVTGAVGGLVPGAIYYLGLTLGTLTTTAPTLNTQSVVQVGEALTTTIMTILPRRPVFL